MFCSKIEVCSQDVDAWRLVAVGQPLVEVSPCSLMLRYKREAKPFRLEVIRRVIREYFDLAGHGVPHLRLAGQPVDKRSIRKHAVLVLGVAQLGEQPLYVLLGDLVAHVCEDVLQLR